MDSELLRTFQAICDKGTTLAAAEVLGISQSAVSRRLTQIETELGLAMFVRERGRLIPTPENRALRAQILTVLAQNERLATMARELGSGNSAMVTLRVAVPASLTMTIIPQVMRDFTAISDRVQVEIHTGTYDTIERMLLDDRAEIGFLRMPTQRLGLASTPLFAVDTVCVMPADHPMAAREAISIRDLSNEPLILLGKMRQPRHEIDLLFMSLGLRPKIRIEAHSVMSACALAAHGLGITLVNGLMARDYAHLPIAIRPLTEPLRHHFAFAMPENIPPSETARRFIEVAERRFAQILTV
ncbi:LysR family transcriptional regulator [Paracoccus aminophilus]|uniref:Transcriptional regulator, LysR family n=1 Tax=Paracoccus aminophilus JCM 7686 TaxID=1367847 RepID=S5XUF7_PARAH|nr:LysR family transcriptional regulator [Paracoccus aminophilus]AGT08842.1 transcriptional regulator, LysR family [Paracoccus aminophilus JCM 7686]